MRARASSRDREAVASGPRTTTSTWLHPGTLDVKPRWMRPVGDEVSLCAGRPRSVVRAPSGNLVDLDEGDAGRGAEAGDPRGVFSAGQGDQQRDIA